LGKAQQGFAEAGGVADKIVFHADVIDAVGMRGGRMAQRGHLHGRKALVGREHGDGKHADAGHVEHGGPQ
jgi:hypothetical protein